MIETASDRAVFVADFGTSASWGGGTVVGIFHNGTVAVDQFEGPGVLNRRATLSLPEAQLPSGAGEGDAVTIGAVSYVVKSVEPDGTGWCLVRLEEVVAD